MKLLLWLHENESKDRFAPLLRLGLGLGLGLLDNGVITGYRVKDINPAYMIGLREWCRKDKDLKSSNRFGNTAVYHNSIEHFLFVSSPWYT